MATLVYVYQTVTKGVDYYKMIHVEYKRNEDFENGFIVYYLLRINSLTGNTVNKNNIIEIKTNYVLTFVL